MLGAIFAAPLSHCTLIYPVAYPQQRQTIKSLTLAARVVARQLRDTDALIGLSYYAIPVVLVYFLRKRRNLPFNWIFWMFAGFILACGTTHLMEIWNIWHGDYVLAGVIKAITAVLSVLTAAMLIPLTPKAIALPALQTLNRELEAALKDLLEQKFALDQHAIVATTARPPSPVTGLQPEMEVPDRNRKHGTRCRRGDSINRIILADRRNR